MNTHTHAHNDLTESHFKLIECHLSGGSWSEPAGTWGPHLCHCEWGTLEGMWSQKALCGCLVRTKEGRLVWGLSKKRKDKGARAQSTETLDFRGSR